MDPFTIASGIIQILQATGTVIAICYDYSATVRNQPTDLTQILGEVRQLRDVLDGLQKVAERSIAASRDGQAADEERPRTSDDTLSPFNAALKPASDMATEMLPILQIFADPDEGPLKSCLEELSALEKKLTPPGWTGPPGSKRRALIQALGWPLKEKDAKRAVEHISRFRQTLNLAISTDQLAISLAIKDDVKEVQEGIKHTATEMKDMKEHRHKEMIKAWLAAPDPYLNHSEAKRKRHASTGTWFLASKRFKEFKNISGSFLWLYGIPGCGKTILASSIIEDLLVQTQSLSQRRGKVTAVVYFYFDFNDVEKQLHEKMLRSLISQLSAQLRMIPSALEGLWTQSMDGERQPDVRGLHETLCAVFAEFEEVFIVLDALDECRERMSLMETIQRMFSWKDEGIKSHIIVTSRREPDIEQSMEDFIAPGSRIGIQNSQVDEDIRAYVCERLKTDQKLRRYKNKPDIQLEIESTLMIKAGGMFRWAVCQLDALGDCLNLPMLRKSLASLPKTLDETYARILMAIPEDRRDITLQVLQWLCYSSRPLGIEELAEIITVDIHGSEGTRFNPEYRLLEPKELLSMGGSLISMTKAHRDYGGEQVRLAHFSVKEYLVSKRIMDGPAAYFSVRREDSHVSIAETCLAYVIEFDNGDSFSEDMVKGFPLIQYAAQFWYLHSQVALSATKDRNRNQDEGENKVHDLALELFTSPLRKLAYENSLRIFNPDKPWKSPSLADALLASREDVDAASSIYYASLTGLYSIVESMLEHNADPNAIGGLYGTPLQAASFSGQDRIVGALLASGAKINTATPQGLYGSALQAACGSGHESTVRLLLSAQPEKADVNAQGGKYANALYAAADKGHSAIVRILLCNGAHVNAKGGVYGNALQVAAFNGHDQVVALLLASGADVNAQDGVYGSALQAASCNDNEIIIRQLLSAGADPNSSGGVYGFALQGASFNGRKTVARLLLEAGADPNARGGVYNCALQAASFRGRAGVVDLLLEAGADVNAPGGSYGTALYAASLGGHSDIVGKLLSTGAELHVNELTGLYGSALNAASFGNHVGVAKILIESGGADPNAIGGIYGTALQTAAAAGHDSLVQWLLIAQHVNPNVVAGMYGTALQAACAEGHISIATMLLKSNADVNIRAGKYGSALRAAQAKKRMAIARYLQEMGATESEPADAEGARRISAMDDVASLDAVSQFEFPKSASEAMRIDSSGRNPLQVAASLGSVDLLKALVAHYEKLGVRIDERDVALYSHIFCDDCGRRVANWEWHYHCSICLDDDFDLCADCVEGKGVHCRDSEHVHLRRKYGGDGGFVLE